MTSQLESMFASHDPATEPPIPPGFTERVVAAGRRSVHRRRTRIAAAVLAIAAAAAPATVNLAVADQAPASTSGPGTLPDHIAGFSPLTATVGRSPSGRAIMLYTYGGDQLTGATQSLVLAADADRYRRVDVIEDRGADTGCRPQALLSPDGTRVLTVTNDGGAVLTLADLTTGTSRNVLISTSIEAALLAWSPDGRYVAFASLPVTVRPSCALAVSDAWHDGELRVLDVTTGKIVNASGLTSVLSVAFAPDSNSLAAQTGEEVHVMSLSGQPLRTLAIQRGRRIAPGVAWSPDGALLATVSRVSGPQDHPPSFPVDDYIWFLDMTGADSPPGPADGGMPLGWVSPTQLLTFTVAPDETAGTISETPVGGGKAVVIAEFEPGRSCTFGAQRCRVTDLSLATGLLPGLITREAGGADRGPWPAWAVVALGTVLAAAVLVSYAVLRRWRYLGGRLRA